MHALNAYFGRRMFTAADFAKLTREYDVAAGQPPGTSNVGGPGGFFGELGVREPDPHTLFHFAVARAGDPFDEAFNVSDESQSPARAHKLRSSGLRGSCRHDRPSGAWTRPRLNPSRVARQGVRAVFVFVPGHVWIWRFGRLLPGSPAAWYRVDPGKNGGRPTPGDPAAEWNGEFGIGIAVPRAFRADA